jgi:hypothetical protein|nr:MAG TPA: hypothetical protein [Caudoviricetes sp.]
MGRGILGSNPLGLTILKSIEASVVIQIVLYGFAYIKIKH